MKVQRVGFLDADIQVAFEDVQRHNAEIVAECMKVWDSMSGRLPRFDEFCSFYVKGKLKEWYEKMRWN